MGRYRAHSGRIPNADNVVRKKAKKPKKEKKPKKIKYRNNWNTATNTNMATFTETTWSVEAAQAMLAAGRTIVLESGVYDLGTAFIGLEFTRLNTSLLCFGNVRFNYTGLGSAFKYSTGSSGQVSGFDLDGIIDQSTGTPLGVGVELYGSAITMTDFRIREFGYGIWCENGEVISYRDGFIRGCEVGIGFNQSNAQNSIRFEQIKFRNNQTHVDVRKARNVSFVFCDFESAYGYAVSCGSSTAGSFQGVVFDTCWFEKNNTAYLATDARAEIHVDSGPWVVRGLKFRDCSWGNLNGSGGSQNKSTSHIYIADVDLADTTWLGWQDPYMVISGPNGIR